MNEMKIKNNCDDDMSAFVLDECFRDSVDRGSEM